jgi:hypothetical protein
MKDSFRFDPTAKFVSAGGSARNKATYLSAHVLLQTSQDHEPHTFPEEQHLQLRSGVTNTVDMEQHLQLRSGVTNTVDIDIGAVTKTWTGSTFHSFGNGNECSRLPPVVYVLKKG